MRIGEIFYGLEVYLFDLPFSMNLELKDGCFRFFVFCTETRQSYWGFETYLHSPEPYLASSEQCYFSWSKARCREDVERISKSMTPAYKIFVIGQWIQIWSLILGTLTRLNCNLLMSGLSGCTNIKKKSNYFVMWSSVIIQISWMAWWFKRCLKILMFSPFYVWDLLSGGH